MPLLDIIKGIVKYLTKVMGTSAGIWILHV